MRDLSMVVGDGTRLYVEEHGDSQAEVTVVLTHGWALDRRSWRRQLADLPAAVAGSAGAAGPSGRAGSSGSTGGAGPFGSTGGGSVRILAYDHRGHGRSDPAAPGTATIAQLGDDLAEVLACRVPTGRVVLAGHSMGGMTIMALAERHPALFAERVAAVAFVSTSAGGLRRGGAVLPRRFDRLTARVVAGGNRPPGRAVAAAARWWLRRSLFGPAAGPVPVALATEIIAAHWPATLLAFRGTFDDHERHAALAGCAGLPVVVLCGSGDRLCPPGHSRRIAAAAPGAELVVYPGTGHMLTLERPAEVTGWIAALVRAAHGAPDAVPA